MTLMTNCRHKCLWSLIVQHLIKRAACLLTNMPHSTAITRLPRSTMQLGEMPHLTTTLKAKAAQPLGLDPSAAHTNNSGKGACVCMSFVAAPCVSLGRHVSITIDICRWQRLTRCPNTSAATVSVGWHWCYQRSRAIIGRDKLPRYLISACLMLALSTVVVAVAVLGFFSSLFIMYTYALPLSPCCCNCCHWIVYICACNKTPQHITLTAAMTLVAIARFYSTAKGHSVATWFYIWFCNYLGM